MPGSSDNISPKTSLYRVPGLRDTIALKRLCAVCQIYVTIFPLKCLCAVCQVSMKQLTWNVCFPSARFTWPYFPWSVSVRCARFHWHNCPKNVCVLCASFTWQNFLYNVSVPCARLTWKNCPKSSVCRVPGLRDSISPLTSLCRVPGLRDIIALKQRCAAFQAYVAQLHGNVFVSCARLTRIKWPETIFVTIFPGKCLCTVFQAFVAQLPWYDCVPCARITWHYFLSNVSVPCARLTWLNCANTSVCRLRVSPDNISPKRLCTVCQASVTPMLQNVYVRCARFMWQYFPYNASVPCSRLTWHNCTETSVCRLP